MKSLRRWQFDSASPFSLQLAADARLSPTDSNDDQVWEVLPGGGESPALALQTRFGGRAGLVSLVPMWLHEGRPIYEAQAYAKPPYVTGFAPGYVRLQATLTPQLALQAEFWAMESHAIGARFTIANAHTEPTSVRFEMVGFVGMSGKEQALSIVPLPDGNEALALGRIGNVQPMVVISGLPPLQTDNTQTSATAPVTRKSSKPHEGFRIGQDFTVEGRKKIVLHFVHAGLFNARDSLALAQKWLQSDWTAAFQKIEQAAQAIPEIETGDADADAAIAYSHLQLAQSFLRPTANLPCGTIAALRQADHDPQWKRNEQSPTLAYLAALGIASINPDFAQGIIRNYIAVQQADGWIDGALGSGGQKTGKLCLPLLARLAWGIFQYTEDAQFLRDVFPSLMKFFARWLEADLDKDGDGLPEWQSETQTGYVFTPTFATWQGWAQGADIRLVESPDLAAYLLSEANSLREIAYYLRDTAAEQTLKQNITVLQKVLESLWNDERGRYTYRDRDTHETIGGVSIIHDAHGNDELLPAEPLTPPNRLIVRVAGGVNLVPRMTMMLDGLNANGQPIRETVSGSDFVWAGGRGTFTSQSVFSQIDRVTFEGLSRVYQVDVNTMDTTALDINALLPLWSAGLPPEHTKPLLNLLTNPEHFWCGSGVTMNSAQDAHFDPSNANGSGGVWLFWNTLMGEALVELGELEKATDLFKRILRMQINVLKVQKRFSEFYHSEEAKGSGLQGHLSGVVPLYLMLRVFGVRIISSRKVWAGGAFFWEQPVTIRQHGVIVRRAREGTHVEFPSGHKVDIPGDTWQEVNDPNA